MEKTLLLIKPDGVMRGLIGEVLLRVQRRGLKIVALKMLQMSRKMAEEFYSVHRDREFFEPLVEFMCKCPIVAVVVQGPNAIKAVRQLNGATNSIEAASGSIRGDFALSVRYNVVHGADSPESVERELPIIFEPHEILDYDIDSPAAFL